MIPVEYYNTVYYSILSLCVLLMVLPLFKYANLESDSKSLLNFKSAVLLIVVIGFIGLRDPWGNWRYFGDTASYTLLYESIKFGGDIVNIKDPGFYLLMKFCGKFMPIQMFYIICAFIYVGLPFLAFKKWFKEYAFFALLLFVVSMPFWGFGINGLRNGLATSVLIYAFSFRTQRIKMYLLMILALSFHRSVFLPIAAYFIAIKYSNTKMLINIWLVIIVVSYYIGNSLEQFYQYLLSFFNIIDPTRSQNLFSDNLDGQNIIRGYRLDFVLYSGFAILLGYIYIIKKDIKDVFYILLFNIYIISNTIWVLLIYAAYTNRIAYLSWFLMPIVMLYPLLKYKIFNNQNRIIAYLIFGSLGFTLILYFK